MSYLTAAATGRTLEFPLTPNGPRMRVKAGQKQAGFTSAYILREMAETELAHLSWFLPEGGCFLDCGANIGIYTLRAAEIVGPKGHVLSFEPAAESFTRLQAHVMQNKLSQVTCFQQALSDRAGSATLYHGGGGPNAYSLLNSAGANTQEIVSTTTIDAIAEQRDLDRVDVIKLDVEGAEPAALEGARTTISRFRPIVIFENILLDDMNTHDAVTDMHDWFRSTEYTYHALINDQLVPIGERDVYGNIIAVPRERLEAYLSLHQSL